MHPQIKNKMSKFSFSLENLKRAGFIQNPSNKNEFIFDPGFWAKKTQIPRCKKNDDDVLKTMAPPNQTEEEDMKLWRAEMEKKHQSHIAASKLQEDLDNKKKAFEAEERRKAKTLANVAKTATVVMNREQKKLAKKLVH